MISDVLVESLADIQSYLDDPTFAEIYSGELRAEIVRVMDAMESLRQRLDRPPPSEHHDRGSP
jgi:hypothetical protein